MSLQRQRGMTIWGFIFAGALVAFAAILAFKAVPAWIEFFAVKKAITTIASSESSGATVADIRRAFQRHADVNDIESVKAADLDITKVRGDVVITASYSRKIPLFGNASLVFDFEASSAKGGRSVE